MFKRKVPNINSELTHLNILQIKPMQDRMNQCDQGLFHSQQDYTVHKQAK